MFLSNSLVLLVSGLTLGQAYYGDDHPDLTSPPYNPLDDFTCDHVPHGLRKLQNEDPALSGGPINPCEELGPGLYPFGDDWWYDWLTSSSTKYIQCGDGGYGGGYGHGGHGGHGGYGGYGGGGYGRGYGHIRGPSCDVKHCAPGTVFNPVIGNCVHDCDVGNYYNPPAPTTPAPTTPAPVQISVPKCYNSCLYAVSGPPVGYGQGVVEKPDWKPVFYLPFDPEYFCMGAPIWEGKPMEADVAGYDDEYSSKFIQCDKFGGCFVQPCAPGTKWDQYEQTCVSAYYYGYYGYYGHD